MEKREYKNPASTVDVIVEKEEKILLIRRKYEPFKNVWALPGGFIDYGKETLEEAASRELKEETGLVTLSLKLFGVYSSPDRDPRGHTISHVYTAKVSGKLRAWDDAKEAAYFPLDNLPELAFDHEKILEDYSLDKRDM